MRTETVTKAKTDAKPEPDADKPGVPHPVTGEPGPPGTTGWVENMPVNDAGMDMNTYHKIVKEWKASVKARRDASGVGLTTYTGTHLVKPAPKPATEPES